MAGLSGPTKASATHHPIQTIGSSSRGALFGTSRSGVPAVNAENQASSSFLQTLRMSDTDRSLYSSSSLTRMGDASNRRRLYGSPRPHSATRSSFATRRAAPSPLGYLDRKPPTYRNLQSRVDHGVEYGLEESEEGKLYRIVRARPRTVGKIVEGDGMYVRSFVEYGQSKSASDTFGTGRRSASVRRSFSGNNNNNNDVHTSSTVSSAVDLESLREEVLQIEREAERVEQEQAMLSREQGMLSRTAVLIEPTSRPFVASRTPPPRRSPLEEEIEHARILRESHRAELLAHHVSMAAGAVVFTRDRSGRACAVPIPKGVGQEVLDAVIAAQTQRSTSSNNTNFRKPTHLQPPILREDIRQPLQPETSTPQHHKFSSTPRAGDFLAAVAAHRQTTQMADSPKRPASTVDNPSATSSDAGAFDTSPWSVEEIASAAAPEKWAPVLNHPKRIPFAKPPKKSPDFHIPRTAPELRSPLPRDKPPRPPQKATN